MSINNEFGNIAFDLPKNQSNVIKVIGVGGGGSNAINHMFQQGIKGVDFVICNTDAQALQNSGVPNKIQLGVNLTEGLGAGANPEIGQEAAIESLEDIRRMLDTNTKMVFITAGMGGGTGTGAAPIIAKMAREMDILTVGIVTMPFQFEGKMRNEQAQRGIENLRQHVDSLVVINNNKLREVYGNLGFKAGFSKADEVLSTASRGIAEVITHHYTQNIDLRDAKTVLSNSGTAIMGSATASGQTRAQEAIRKALDSPLLNDNKITGAKNVLLLIVSGAQEITIDEIGEINDHIQSEAGYGANIIMGVGEDESLQESISVTIIATGFNIDQQNEISNTEVKKVIHALEDNDAVAESPSKQNKETLPSEDNSNNAKTQNKDTPIIHTLGDEEDNITHKDNEGLIPTTDAIKNIDIVYDEVLDMRAVDTQDDDFIITTSSSEEDVTESSEPTEEQITLTFDLPLSQIEKKDKDAPKSKDDELLFQLDDAVNDIVVNDAVEFVPVSELSNEGEKRYVLEVEASDAPSTAAQDTAADTNDDMGFETKVVTKEAADDNSSVPSSVDPIHTPISELLKARANERRKKMKDFNYKFNAAKIDDIEKEPAYKRQGVHLEDVQSSSDVQTSRTSVSTDDNDEIQLRSNNSFLHDNVD